MEANVESVFSSVANTEPTFLVSDLLESAYEVFGVESFVVYGACVGAGIKDSDSVTKSKLDEAIRVYLIKPVV